MASKVKLFLSESGGSNFTETAPRPPVPGEENELQSNGGQSTRSSGSRKSQVSTKSHASSNRSLNSNKGDVNQSPAATPRKSNKTGMLGQCCECSEEEAPLGFEPEGSAANSPPFTENSTPPYLKWAENLNFLLDDRDGVQLFRKFLEDEGIGSSSVDFWFACQGLKKKHVDDSQIQNVIRVINKKYIKSDKLPFLTEESKHEIFDKIQRKNELDQSIFDMAQGEVEHEMRNNTYPLFLKSDLYVQYVQKGGESPKSSNTSSGSNSARPLSLPTLPEDQELEITNISYISDLGPPPVKLCSTGRTRYNCEGAPKTDMFSVPYPGQPSRTIPHPYHLSYTTVSAQDSEIQSLSSDALTDDTRSLTDSSVDGLSHRESKKFRKQQRAMQKRAEQNRESAINQYFIPRTDRAPKDRNIAEIDPKSFAKLLIEKLERVQKEQEKEERLQESMSKVMSQSDISDEVALDKSYLNKSCTSSSSGRNNNTATSLVPLMSSSIIGFEEENADSILDEHCSRIWERSAQDTPSRSPGRHSPSRSKSPDRTLRKDPQGRPLSGPASVPGTLHTKSLHSKKRPDYYSTLSFDSGMGEDKNAFETHKHIHHHHHHHHGRESKSKSQLEIEAQNHSMVCWGDYERKGDHDRGRTARKTNRKHSDSSSNIDSGISLVESVSPVPNIADPATTKVLQWMMGNENRGASSAYPDSDKSSSHKRSGKTSVPSAVYSQGHKSSTSKKSSMHGNRSTSAERGTGWASVPAVIKPNQPFMQDPSMPLMPHPNTTMQLDEVNRRLVLEADLARPVKSKSFAGVPSKRPNVPTSQSSTQMQRPAVPGTKTVPCDLDISGDTTSSQSTAQTAEKRSKKSSGSGNTSTSSKPEETVIGYYLCGEPIPYRITIQSSSVTLGQFKHLISKKGNYRYFFKTYSNSKEFDSDVVFEEIKDDGAFLPLWDGKVVAKVDKIDQS
ncbi:hypothetical protein CHS0354_028064 [Potamilus streckersoni]|uniref:Axin n=1 Tax=Potamilus streckersoni TaxID=2493646 RepID=A0AAE0THZ3_9BIVA|nr:hypothetical protein CHS0354_028064 [Potamilus streckersoni]